MDGFEPASEIADAVRAGRRSPVDVVETCLDRIDANSDLNAFVTVLADRARSRARAADRAVEASESVGPLHGVPVAVKDAYAHVAGVPSTFGSRAMTEFVPERSAPLVDRLENAGAIVVGKTNTPEFASRGTTNNDLVGRTRNPFARDYTASGSSGGSGAAVAAGLVPLAQGSDHAGSVRMPASACGVVGVFPTPGRVPQAFRPDAYRYDLPHVSSGPLARTVQDAAITLDVLSGPHPDEPRSLPDEPTFVDATDRPVTDLDVAYSPDLGGFAVDPDVRSVVDGTAQALESAGATVERADPDVTDWSRFHDSIMLGLEVLLATFARNLEAEHGIDLLERQDAVDSHVIERIRRGREHGAVEYKRANVARTDLFVTVQRLFERYDLLLTPTLAVPPFRSDRGPPSTVDGSRVELTLGWLLTWPFNLTGHPAVSVPAGTVDGRPVGAQIVGPRFDDRTVISAAAAVERVDPWAGAYPQ